MMYYFSRFNASEIVAFIGIDQPRTSVHKWRSGSEADWMQFLNENGDNYWKVCIVFYMFLL